MSAPRLLAPTTISGGVPTAGAGTLNTIALWTPDGNTLGNSLLTQSGNIVTNASGAIRALGTTQTSPAFTRHDTTTSGIYFPATNEIGFTISSQHAMFISSGRNIGIGTVSPAGKLDIADAASASVYISRPGLSAVYGAAGLGNLRWRDTANAFDAAQISAVGYFPGSNGQMAFSTASAGVQTERMRITDTGNVGIGTANPWAKTAMVATNNISTISFGFSFDSANNYRHGISTVFSSSSTAGNMMSFCVSDTTATGYTRVLTLNGAGQAALGTTSFTTGRALTTVADLDVFGVRVGRGGGDVATNIMLASGANLPTLSGTNNVGIGVDALRDATTAIECIAIGNSACRGNNSSRIGIGFSACLNAGANSVSIGSNAGVGIGPDAVAVGAYAGYLGGGGTAYVGVNAGLWKGVDNTAVGALALGSNPGTAQATCIRNTAVGRTALGAAINGSEDNAALGYEAGKLLTTGDDNVLLGANAGDSITTGNSNIVIGSGADVAAAGDSNQFVLGDATNYVATNGGATTYYATAGASLGYMRVRLNGTYVKIEVFADV